MNNDTFFDKLQYKLLSASIETRKPAQAFGFTVLRVVSITKFHTHDLI
jgi:hypothetical protein